MAKKWGKNNGRGNSVGFVGVVASGYRRWQDIGDGLAMLHSLCSMIFLKRSFNGGLSF